MNGNGGEVEAPGGSPLIATLRGPVNPFCPVAETSKVALVVPGAAVSMVGDTAILKSGVGLMVSVSEAECDKVPEVPVTVSGKLPMDAGTDKTTVCCLLPDKRKGDAGEVLAPAGRPEIATVTGSAKPF